MGPSHVGGRRLAGCLVPKAIALDPPVHHLRGHLKTLGDMLLNHFSSAGAGFIEIDPLALPRFHEIEEGFTQLPLGNEYQTGKGVGVELQMCARTSTRAPPARFSGGPA